MRLSLQCSVTYPEERHAVYFAILTWLGASKWRHTGKQTTIARQTDSEDTDIVGAVLESGAAAECNDYSHIVQPYRFEPYGKVSKAHRLSVKGNMNNPRLVSTLYRVYKHMHQIKKI